MRTVRLSKSLKRLQLVSRRRSRKPQPLGTTLRYPASLALLVLPVSYEQCVGWNVQRSSVADRDSMLRPESVACTDIIMSLCVHLAHPVQVVIRIRPPLPREYQVSNQEEVGPLHEACSLGLPYQHASRTDHGRNSCSRHRPFVSPTREVSPAGKL